ncbi:MAG TPA: RAMP superfamily CRISPR-associated protein [Ktedonobacteraceae bacterium]
MFVQLDYTLSFQAPSHFGTGTREGLIDRTVIRDAGNYLYVPASTFKGVLREHCEHLCHFYAQGDQQQKRARSPHNADATLDDFSGTPTLINSIFGSSLVPGEMLFSDARQPKQTRREYKDAQVSVFTQVRIDRLSQTAVGEALYTSQFGIRDLIFAGHITGRLDSFSLPELARSVGESVLTPTGSLLLLLAGLLLLERLGGNKSAGKGQCQCEIDRLALDRQFCDKRIWRAWLEKLDVLGDYSETEKGLLA